MKFGEAFRSLGYALKQPRTDWSAQSEKGVCLTLWKRQTDFRSLVMDTREHAGPSAEWQHKAGNKRRIADAALAVARFEGWIDAVMLDGEPGSSYGDAHPWDAATRGRRWRITFLDEGSGHLRVEAQ